MLLRKRNGPGNRTDPEGHGVGTVRILGLAFSDLMKEETLLGVHPLYPASLCCLGPRSDHKAAFGKINEMQ